MPVISTGRVTRPDCGGNIPTKAVLILWFSILSSQTEAGTCRDRRIPGLSVHRKHSSRVLVPGDLSSRDIKVLCCKNISMCKSVASRTAWLDVCIRGCNFHELAKILLDQNIMHTIGK